MNCKKCGFQLNQDDQFCKNCGASVNVQESNQNIQESSQNIQQSDNKIENNELQNNLNTNSSNSVLQNNPSTNNNLQSNYSNINTNQQSSNQIGKYIAIAAGAFAFAIVLMVVGIVAVTTLNKGKNKTIESETTATEVATKTYKVSYNGFVFTIPEDIIVQEEEGTLAIFDETDQWVVYTTILEGNFKNILINKKELLDQCQERKAECSEFKEKKVNGVDYLVSSVNYYGDNIIYGFAKVDSEHVAMVNAFSIKNEIDYKLLEKSSSVLKNAEKVQTIKGIKKSNFNLDNISEYIK